MSTPTNLSPSGIPAQHLIAHRGYQQHFPENSPRAINEAIACGAEYIEIDVQFSADGAPLLCHDDDLQRIAGINKKLSACTFDELVNITANEPSRFTTRFQEIKIAPLQSLVDIMQKNPHIQVLVELKEEAIRDYGETFCLSRIHEVLTPVLESCILISFDIDALRLAKESSFPRLAPVLRQWNMRYELAQELNAEMIICNYKRIPEHDSLQMENGSVAVYEVDNIVLGKHLLSRGANFIETFSIGEMLGIYGKR